jgi:hypothetical protein
MAAFIAVYDLDQAARTYSFVPEICASAFGAFRFRHFSLLSMICRKKNYYTRKVKKKRDPLKTP